MQTHKAKRVEITSRRSMESRLTACAEQGGRHRLYRPAGAGRVGPVGRMEPIRAGQPGQRHGAGGLHHPADRLDALLDAAFSVVERHIGVCRPYRLRGAAGRTVLTRC